MKKILGVAGVMLALSAVGVPAASADSTTLASYTITARSAGSAARIVCHVQEGMTISNPHHSHHEPRNVNVFGTITCSSKVPTINMAVRLFRNGKVANSKTFTKFEKSYFKGNASAGCKGTSGLYQGTIDVRVVFPPRYVPPTESGHLKSKVVRVDCWK